MFGLFGGKTVTLTVEGMTCEGCVKGVERSLGAVPGVKKVVVSLKDKTAQVTVGSVDAAQLIKAVEGAGYKAAESAQ
jgi:copper chaperone CopZ